MMLSLLGAGIQCLWAWLRDGWSSKKQGDPKGVCGPKSCTVVVCCHNESERVAPLHSALSGSVAQAQKAGLNVNVLAVNHGSTDDTLHQLQRVSNDDPTWSVIDVERTVPSKKEALAFGVGHAQGQVLLLTDADCAPVSQQWVLDMVQGASESWDVHIGLSLPTPHEHASPMTWLNRLQRLEARRIAQRTVGAFDAGSSYMAFGRNLAFTKEIWERVGGFDRHNHVLSGDDDLWLQSAFAAGARVHASTHAASQTTSTWPNSWRAWRRQKTRHFTASSMYPWSVRVALLMPGLGWLLLLGGVVHNPSVTSATCMSLALMVRTLTFGLFLRRIDQPATDAWELLLEPVTSVFRIWSWWRGQISDSTPWK